MYKPKPRTVIYAAMGIVFAALCVQLYLAHVKLDSIYSNMETGYDVGGLYRTSKDQPKEPNENDKQFVWSRFEKDEASMEGMSGHWTLLHPIGPTSHSGFWKEADEPNTFELYDITSESRVGSMRLYFASKYADGRIWLELNGELLLLYQVSK